MMINRAAKSNTPAFCSLLGSHANIFRSACLDLLGHSPQVDSEMNPIINFAIALMTETPAESLIVLYRKIESPGVEIAVSLMQGLMRMGKLDAAIELADEIDAEKLSPRHRLIYAELLAEQGEYDKILSHIAQAYEEDRTLKDAHARIAWKHFWPKKEYDKVIEWMEKDACSTDGSAAQ